MFFFDCFEGFSGDIFRFDDVVSFCDIVIFVFVEYVCLYSLWVDIDDLQVFIVMSDGQVFCKGNCSVFCCGVGRSVNLVQQFCCGSYQDKDV